MVKLGGIQIHRLVPAKVPYPCYSSAQRAPVFRALLFFASLIIFEKRKKIKLKMCFNTTAPPIGSGEKATKTNKNFSRQNKLHKEIIYTTLPRYF